MEEVDQLKWAIMDLTVGSSMDISINVGRLGGSSSVTANGESMVSASAGSRGQCTSSSSGSSAGGSGYSSGGGGGSSNAGDGGSDGHDGGFGDTNQGDAGSGDGFLLDSILISEFELRYIINTKFVIDYVPTFF